MTMIREMLSARRAVRAMLTAALGAGLLAAAGCSSDDVEHQYPEQIGGSDQHDPLGRSTNTDEQVGSLLDEDGLVGGALKRKSDKENEENTEEEAAEKSKAAREEAELALQDSSKLGVNSYLWRATLDTLSFMPLASADPYGGVIITDWSINPKAPRERFKVTVYILDKRLRADGIKASVFRQVRSDAGVWVDQPVADETKIQIENAILTRARQLRVASLDKE